MRGSLRPDEPEAQAVEPRRHCSPSWARLIATVYQVDPLVCTRCGQRMSLIAFVTDQMAIGKILDHLGLSTPEADKPPHSSRIRGGLESRAETSIASFGFQRRPHLVNTRGRSPRGMSASARPTTSSERSSP